MDKAITPRLLFVDDEPDLLQLYTKIFGTDYDAVTANSGAEAIAALNAVDEPFAVIVCDLNMPEMNGLEVLDQAKAISPDTVRIMLTGFASEETAIQAVNQGDVFKFLTKPVRVKEISGAIEDAVRRFDVHAAERELLERTLRGSIEMLTQALSLASPGVFGRSRRLADDMLALCAEMDVSDVWAFETTAMLSQIGLLASPNSLITKIINDDELSEAELEDFWYQSDIGAELISKVPRLESVAENIRYQYKNFDGSGYPDDAVSGRDIPQGARMLRALQDMQLELNSGHSRERAFANMRRDSELYDPRILAALEASTAGHYSAEYEEVSVIGMEAGSVLLEDLYNHDGVLVLRAGQEVSRFLAEKLSTFAAAGEIQSMIKIVH